MLSEKELQRTKKRKKTKAHRAPEIEKYQEGEEDRNPHAQALVLLLTALPEPTSTPAGRLYVARVIPPERHLLVEVFPDTSLTSQFLFPPRSLVPPLGCFSPAPVTLSHNAFSSTYSSRLCCLSTKMPALEQGDLSAGSQLCLAPSRHGTDSPSVKWDDDEGGLSVLTGVMADLWRLGFLWLLQVLNHPGSSNILKAVLQIPEFLRMITLYSLSICRQKTHPENVIPEAPGVPALEGERPETRPFSEYSGERQVTHLLQSTRLGTTEPNGKLVQLVPEPGTAAAGPRSLVRQDQGPAGCRGVASALGMPST
ncbi:hypothetical protein H8959_017654 [Pygathrix nigripes]